MLKFDGKHELGSVSKAWYRLRLAFRDQVPVIAEVGGAPPLVRFVCTTLRELKRAATLYSKEEGTIAWLDRELRPDDVFLDIGANIGMYTLYAGLRLDGKGAVIAVEPHLVNAARLMENVQANGLGDRVSVLTIALAGEPGFGTFHYRDWGAGSSNSQVGRSRDSTGEAFDAAARELKSVATRRGRYRAADPCRDAGTAHLGKPSPLPASGGGARYAGGHRYAAGGLELRAPVPPLQQGWPATPGTRGSGDIDSPQCDIRSGRLM
jgi:FkbM family methyltransferase